MLNLTDRYIVYLDPDTLKYMYLTYSKSRNYPVMNKLFTLLHDGYVNNLILIPITFDHIVPYIEENKIEIEFINMMGELGQIQFHQRFTVRTLQLIRVINSFFDQNYKKPLWRDAFSSDPDTKYTPGFNKYRSLSTLIVLKAVEREKNNSQIYFFIESFKEEKPLDSIAGNYYNYLWEMFPDIIMPFLPSEGSPEYHIKKFFECEGIRDIPEFHIISNILYQLFKKYGIQDIEHGLKDDLLLAAEKMAVYMPYCNFFVTNVDIAELVNMTGINEPYNVNVYDNNESSLYRLIDDLTNAFKHKSLEKEKKSSRTIFRKTR